MINNLDKVTTSNSKLMDPMMCRKFIETSMYLVNTRPDMSFAMKILTQLMVDPRQEKWVASNMFLGI